MRLNSILAVVPFFLAFGISAQTVGPEFSSEPFAGVTSGASLAADQKGPVFAWCARRTDGESRVFIARPDDRGQLDARELTPLGASPHPAFDWPAIAADGREAVVVARQFNAIVGWAINRDATPHFIAWNSSPPALTGNAGRFYLATKTTDPAEVFSFGQMQMDEIVRTASATVYTLTMNTYNTPRCIIEFCGLLDPVSQGTAGVLSFTADGIDMPTPSDAGLTSWKQAAPVLSRFLSTGQTATIAASARDWLVLARGGNDSEPARLTAYRFVGDGTSAPGAPSTILIATLPPESPGPVRPPAGSRLWFARAAFDGQRYGVAWQETSARGDHDIYFATIDADNKVSAPLLVAGSTADERRPLITATGAGTFFVGYEVAANNSIRVAGRAVLAGPARRRAATR